MRPFFASIREASPEVMWMLVAAAPTFLALLVGALGSFGIILGLCYAKNVFWQNCKNQGFWLSAFTPSFLLVLLLGS